MWFLRLILLALLESRTLLTVVPPCPSCMSVSGTDTVIASLLGLVAFHDGVQNVEILLNDGTSKPQAHKPYWFQLCTET